MTAYSLILICRLVSNKLPPPIWRGIFCYFCDNFLTVTRKKDDRIGWLFHGTVTVGQG